MRKITFCWIILIVITFSCETDNESECDKYCFTPPPSLRFELVDKLTNENLFSNETFDPYQIGIINLDNNKSVDYRFLDYENRNLISINSFGWQTEIINYSIRIDNDEIFTLYVDAERLIEDCCSFTKYNEISIENSEFGIDTINFVYKIFVE